MADNKLLKAIITIFIIPGAIIVSALLMWWISTFTLCPACEPATWNPITWIQKGGCELVHASCVLNEGIIHGVMRICAALLIAVAVLLALVNISIHKFGKKVTIDTITSIPKLWLTSVSTIRSIKQRLLK